MSTINQLFYLKVVHKTMGVEIPKFNISWINIKESVFGIFPSFSMELNDPGNFSEALPIVDGDIITISWAANKTTDANIITLDFKVSEYFVRPIHESKTSKIYITGFLNASDFFFPSKNRGFVGSSGIVLSKLVTEMGISLGTLDATSDAMTWIQDGSNYEFINHILNRSYSPDSAMFAYMDVYGKFNYRDLNKALKQKEKFNAHYNLELAQTLGMSESESNSNIYFKAFDLVSINGEVKRNSGYGVDLVTYDGKTFNITSIKNTQKQTDLFDRQSSVKSSYKYNGGSLNNANVYPDYKAAIVGNSVRKMDFISNGVGLNINGLSQVKCLDKVVLSFPSFIQGGKHINDVHSGPYLVTNIVHTLSSGETYNKQVFLSRCGFNKSLSRTSYNGIQ